MLKETPVQSQPADLRDTPASSMESLDGEDYYTASEVDEAKQSTSNNGNIKISCNTQMIGNASTQYVRIKTCMSRLYPSQWSPGEVAVETPPCAGNGITELGH